MSRVSNIGSLLRKVHRIYGQEVVKRLEQKGFTDLRPSFLDILTFIAEREGISIKLIGVACGLKKQTMTSHLNELEKRGYVNRVTNPEDRREQVVNLSEYGRKFKTSLLEAMSDLEVEVLDQFGSVEFERLELQLTSLYQKFQQINRRSML